MIEEARERVPLRILGYVLMPNHWHLVVWPRDDCDVYSPHAPEFSPAAPPERQLNGQKLLLASRRPVALVTHPQNSKMGDQENGSERRDSGEA